MHAELAYRRYVRASGRERLGSGVKSVFNRVLFSAVSRGEVLQIDDRRRRPARPHDVRARSGPGRRP